MGRHRSKLKQRAAMVVPVLVARVALFGAGTSAIAGFALLCIVVPRGKSSHAAGW
jgi:hypothetical protein